MGQVRLRRVAGEIQKEIGSIVQDELKDPRIGFVTITKVRISPDLRIAKIYFSHLGTKKQLQKTQEGLKRSSGYVRRLLGQRIKLRYTPEIIFVLDENIAYSIHISSLLERIRNKDNERAKNN